MVKEILQNLLKTSSPAHAVATMATEVTSDGAEKGGKLYD